MECKSCIMNNDQTKRIELTIIVSENESGNKVVSFQYPVGFDSDQVEMGQYIRHLTNVYHEFMFQNPFFSSKKNVIKSNPPTIVLSKFDTQYVEQHIEVDLSKEELEKLMPTAIFTF